MKAQALAGQQSGAFLEPVTHPFAYAHHQYQSLGWPVLALPREKKCDPPFRFTGKYDQVAGDKEFKRWLSINPHDSSSFGPNANIGLRMPRGVVGIDVDHYGAKRGAEHLAELIARNGSLPDTFRSTRRDPANPSGIRFYRVPEDWIGRGKSGGDIDIIQHHHRYAVAWPSVVPEFKDGTGELFQYAWYDLLVAECAPPSVTDFPFLPQTWQDDISIKNRNFKVAGSEYRPGLYSPKAQPGEWLNHRLELPADDPCRSDNPWVNDVAWGKARTPITLDEVVEWVTGEDAKSENPYFKHDPEQFMKTVNSAYEARIPEWEGYQNVLAANANKKKAVSVQQVQTSRQPAIPTEGFVPEPGKPVKVARVCAGDLWSVGSDTTLRAWRGQWMEWGGSDWREVETQTVKKKLQDRLEDAKFVKRGERDDDDQVLDWDPNSAKINDVVSALKNITLLSADTETNSWLDGREACRMVAFQNGLLDIETRKLYPASASYFNTTSLPYDYAETDTPPVEWLRFLASVWPQDQQAVEALQEWFGYVLSGQTDLQKALMLIGPPRSGKGTIATVLSALLGQRNVLGVGMSSFTSEFGLQEIVGKSLTIIGDGRAPSRDREMVVEKILNIVGEDAMTINRKYRSPYNGRLATRLMLLSNEVPQLSDPSGALASRFIVLSFTESFLNREDLGLSGRLLKEIPAILRWSLDGLERLNVRGRFVEPGSSEDTRDELDTVTAQIKSFIRDRCELGPGKHVVIEDLFAEYKAWCTNRGYRAGSIDTMGSQIMATNRGKIKKRRLTIKGRRINCYDGLGFKGAKSE
ncbi:phage/plasmid primase, P4 family [Streptomyces sp. NPDC005648]|uniref:phage/plasmid primase, P4 family n=1 Tax=Streptomyces sp. NPDC005648 TaxID=3157044 RepID=UPI0033A47D47